MRNALLKRIVMVTVTAACLLIVWCFAMPGETFAADESAGLKERKAWFEYAFIECNGYGHEASTEFIVTEDSSGSTYPRNFSTTMMLCDSNHLLHVKGGENGYSMTSSNPDVVRIGAHYGFGARLEVLKTGTTEITATIDGDDTYKECKIHIKVTVSKHMSWEKLEDEPVHFESVEGLVLDTSIGMNQVRGVWVRPDATLNCWIKEDTDIARVELFANTVDVIPIHAGKATLILEFDDGGGKYLPVHLEREFEITGEDTRAIQEITGDTGPFTIDCHKGLTLKLQAVNGLSYSIAGTPTGGAKVDQNGHVTFTGAGKADIKVTAPGSFDYQDAETIISVTARDYAAEAAQAAAELQRAKSLKKPKLKIKALKGRKIKLTWNKVRHADGYIIYVKYPGKRKYVKALTKNSTVKSVTHRGLSRKKTYKYKVRAYKVVNGKYYYGPFSKVRKAKVR